jgi:hypothetical protein
VVEMLDKGGLEGGHDGAEVGAIEVGGSG